MANTSPQAKMLTQIGLIRGHSANRRTTPAAPHGPIVSSSKTRLPRHHMVARAFSLAILAMPGGLFAPATHHVWQPRCSLPSGACWGRTSLMGRPSSVMARGRRSPSARSPLGSSLVSRRPNRPDNHTPSSCSAPCGRQGIVVGHLGHVWRLVAPATHQVWQSRCSQPPGSCWGVPASWAGPLRSWRVGEDPPAHDRPWGVLWCRAGHIGPTTTSPPPGRVPPSIRALDGLVQPVGRTEGWLFWRLGASLPLPANLV